MWAEEHWTAKHSESRAAGDSDTENKELWDGEGGRAGDWVLIFAVLPNHRMALGPSPPQFAHL